MNEHKIARVEKKASMYDDEYEEFTITYTPNKAGEYNIYLYGLIISAQQFVSAVEVLGNASDQDVVVIHLSTDGGSLDATDTLITAMNESEAHVVVKASGGVHSAGTLIILAADEFQLSDNANFLFHNGSCGAGGKFSDFISHADHNKKYFERVIRTAYHGFLLETEIDDVLKGCDLWMDSDEFVRRHEARNDVLKEEMEGMIAAMKDSKEMSSGELAALEALTCEQSPKITKKPRKKTLALNT